MNCAPSPPATEEVNVSKIDKDALIEHLTAERDKAREEAGVYKYRMEHYQREMYIHLRISQERKAEVERLREQAEE